MQTIDITEKAKRFIKYGLVGLITLSTAVGGAAFNYQHRDDSIRINEAKVAGTLVSVRVLTNGKVKELTKSDGDEVKAGDVIARIEVSVTEEQIQQLENTVDLAKENYAKLQVGQMVKVPIRKPKVKPKPVKTPAPVVKPQSRSSASSATLASLEERKSRMELLYEMGAISRKQMEEAVKEYELAKAAAESSPAVSAEQAETPQATEESTEIEYEIEYIDQLQPTPPEILNGAQLAIKQAELSLNVAKQQSQQTEIIAPVDGIIYYNVEVDEEVTAGDSIAKVGDSNELWLEAEVTESQFNKISLGKLVSYTIDGNKLTGTVIEKIAPTVEEEMELEEETSDVADPSKTVNENPSSTESQDKVSPVNEQHDGVGGPLIAQADQVEQVNQADTVEQTNSTTNQTDQIEQVNPNESTGNENAPDTNNVDSRKNPTDNKNPAQKDKFIIKFSLPSDGQTHFKPNTTTNVLIY